MDIHREFGNDICSVEDALKGFVAIFEAAEQPMLLINVAGICVQANSAARHFLEKHSAPLVGLAIGPLLNHMVPPIKWADLSAGQNIGITGTASPVTASTTANSSFALKGNILPGYHLLTLAFSAPSEAENVMALSPVTHGDLSLEAAGDGAEPITEIVTRSGVSIARFYAYASRQWETVYLSPGCDQVFGYPLEILEQSGFWQSRVDAEDLPRLLDELFEGVYAERQTAVEYRFWDANEQMRWIVVTVTPQYEPNQSRWLVDAISCDVSDRKQIELHQQAVLRALQHSERLFRGVFNQTFQLSSLLTCEGIVLKDNQTALDFCQLDRQDAVGRPFYELFCWQISPDVQTQLKQAIIKAAQGQTLRYETEIQGPQRERISIDFSLKPLFDESGTVELLIAEGRDITAQKQMMRSLQESEARFSAAFYGCPYPMLITEVEGGRIIEVNDSFCEVTQFERQEAIDRNSLELNLWPAFEDRLSMAEALHNQGQLEFHEATFVTKQGESRTGLVSSRLIEIDQQPYILSVIKDISDLKRIEDSLRLSEKLLANIVNSANAAILQMYFWADYSYQYTYISDGAKSVFTYSKEELLADTNLWRSRVLPEDYETKTVPCYKAILAEKSFDVEYRFRGSDDEIYWISSHGIARRDETQDCWVVTIVEMNISASKQNELDLRASEKRFRTVLENMPLLGVILSREGEIKLCNGSFLELTGWTEAEILHQNWLEQCIPHDWKNRLHQFFNASGDVSEVLPQHYEYEIFTSWGETRLISWRNIAVSTDDFNQIEYACIGEDVTEQRRREVALQRQAMQEQIIVDITRKLRETLDLTTILGTAANSIKSGLMAERVVIFQFETPGSGSIVADTDVIPVVPQYRSPQITAWLDRSRLPQSLEMLDIPILQYSPTASASLWGLLIVYLDTSSPEILPRHEAFLRPLADQLAIAIHQSEQYAQVERELLERQKIAAKFQHDALHDPLTGLYNRLALEEALDDLISNQEFAFAILFLDLDHFKLINDTYGHSAGDQLLQLIAQRLQASIREEDMAVRLGGDEFVLLVRPVVQLSEAIEVARRVHESLAAPISFGFGNIEVRTSIGIAVGTRCLPINRLLAEADHAMYRAKRYQLDYAIASVEDESVAGL